MKKAIGVVLVAFLGNAALAQQMPQYSQYMINQYVLNPAVTGTYDYAHILAGYRNQWVGAFNNPNGGTDAPITYYLSGHTSIGRGNTKPHPFRNRHNAYHGVGGMVYQDQTGPTSHLGALASYAYNTRLTGDWRLAMGVFLGFQQYTLDGSKLNFHEAEDYGTQRKIVPDGSIGLWAYNKYMYVGASVNQIFQSKLNFPTVNSDGSVINNGKLANHYYVTSGIKLYLSHDWALVPSVMLKYNLPAPLSVDLNAKFRYKDMIWFGASYRNLDSFVFLAGIVIGQNFEFGYSYDLTVSKIKSYTAGSHEIVLGLRLWPRVRLDCPSNFW